MIAHDDVLTREMAAGPAVHLHSLEIIDADAAWRKLNGGREPHAAEPPPSGVPRGATTSGGDGDLHREPTIEPQQPGHVAPSVSKL